VRPDTAPGELAKRLRSRELRTALVTTPEGVLIGIVRLDDLERAVEPDRGPEGSNTQPLR
jgi:hypothetical protein